MIELLDEIPLVPEKFLKDLLGTVTKVLNTDYLAGKSKEKALLTFISSTLTPLVLARSLESPGKQVFFHFEISCDESQQRIAQCKERFRFCKHVFVENQGHQGKINGSWSFLR